MNFDTVLIANRGEIAARIIRTTKDMGLRSVAIYTQTDAGTPHTRQADMSVLLDDIDGQGEPYLDIDRIIDVARSTGAGAIHPGYGFLSENEAFARACAKADITFIGPDCNAIRIMGDKAAGKAAMKAVNVACVPGYDGEDQSVDALKIAANEIGTPLLIKAVAGGGGRGMRRVDDLNDFEEALVSARSEARNAFGSDDVILEKLLENVRHIEIQVFGDSHGNVVHLGERDCSSQRRNQKVIEEAPSAFVSDNLRQQLGQAAVKAASAISYIGAGTVEFLVTPDEDFYFIEMNTRLQVEHPVTEEITGQDLVAWQLQVAMGKPLPLSQDEISLTGASMEVRLYAEDPFDEFLPQTGTVLQWREPVGTGIRVDHMIGTGNQISARYDPMIAKIIATGASREIARKRLISALENIELAGFITNKGFLIRCLEHEDFASPGPTTAFIDTLLSAPAPEISALQQMIIAAHTYWQKRHKRQQNADDWSSLGTPFRKHMIEINGDVKTFYIKQLNDISTVTDENKENQITLRLEMKGREISAVHHEDASRPLNWWANGTDQIFDFGGVFVKATQVSFDPASREQGGGDQFVTAPMAGKIIAVETEVGSDVTSGQTVIILEAMKMEHRIRASLDGAAAKINVAIGDQVNKGDQLVEIEC